jgi:Animal haem peroxidase
MERHGQESYFVVGEGLLSEAGGGRATPLAPAAAPPFRFSRMGPVGAGKQLFPPMRKKLAAAMTAGGGGAQGIPAGYTYLGQFIDHDLTFDKTKVMLGENQPPAVMLQARSPSLDLDSLYGAGPDEPKSVRFYRPDGRHLKTGRTVAAGNPAMDGSDLPRGEGNSNAARKKAVIPDPRNDENLAVAQTHLAFIRFHNRVIETLTNVPAGQKFEAARALVVKHYQWMIRHDFLPRICRAAVLNDVFNNGRKAFEVGVNPTDVPTMPIEFSVAAFRLGHSMIRRAYNWNINFDNGAGTLDLLFTFSAGGGNLGGNQKLASNWIRDFRRLYDFNEAGRADLAVPAAKFNRAMRIDTTLSVPLQDLPAGAIGGALPQNDPGRNLAFRNLTRANMVRLATGQQMVSFLRSKGVNVTALTKAELRDGAGGADLSGLTTKQRQAVLTNTPLWFYILREAELNGGKLGGVGGRIVAETFHRAIEGSTHSILRDPTWRPTFGPDPTTFRMVDLLLFAFEGKKKLVAPLG